MRRVRAISCADEPAWRRLWARYNRFYEANVSDEVTDATWRRILDPASPLIGRAAEHDGDLAGFSISVLHECSWTIAPVCYLEDLFVAAEARGGGIGSALIEDVIDLGRERGWSRIYWHTHADNAVARRLYDKFIAADDFVRYRLIVG